MTTQTTPDYDIGGYISKGFELFTKDIGNWILISVVGYFALGVGMWGGYQNCTMIALRGQKPTVNDVLMPFSRFGDFFMPFLFLMLCIFPGALLCGAGFIGAIVLSTWWFFASCLMIDRNIGWKEATRISKEVASKNFFMTFIVAFVAGFIGGIGGMIGLPFLTSALTGIIGVFAYQHIFGASAGPNQLAFAGGAAPAPQPWPQATTPAAAPQGWSAPAPAPAAAPQAAWAPPAAAPAAAPSAWAAPAPAAPMAAPAADGWGAPTAPSPAAAPYVAPAATPAGSGAETATQSSASADEAFVGKTMAMSALDFEKLMNQDKK